MASKIHFRATVQGSAACACNMPKSDGRVTKNFRSTYASIPADSIVGAEDFRNTPDADRCAHCAAQFTAIMNSRRSALGKPLYKDAFTKELA